MLEGLTPQRVLPGLVGIAESKAQIRARIRAIARDGGAPRWRWAACAVAAGIAGVALTNAREESQNKGINLLERYPTTLKAGDTSGAYPWSFSPEDIFQYRNSALKLPTNCESKPARRTLASAIARRARFGRS